LSVATPAPIDLFTAPGVVQERLTEMSGRLAAADEAPPEVLEFAAELSGQVIGIGRGEWPPIDPYLLAELMQTVAAVEQTLRNDEPARQTAELEIELEALRDIFGDIQENGPIRDDRPAIEVARWLKDTTGASNAELSVLGPSKRTWERWLSPSGASKPHGDDEARVRIAAQIVNQLRHALTAPGVMRWFAVGHPALGGRTPAELVAGLEDPAKLVALASEVRRSDAA
jgi:hypothetical protein